MDSYPLLLYPTTAVTESSLLSYYLLWPPLSQYVQIQQPGCYATPHTTYQAFFSLLAELKQHVLCSCCRALCIHAGGCQRGRMKIIFKNPTDCRAQSLTFVLFSLPTSCHLQKRIGISLQDTCMSFVLSFQNNFVERCVVPQKSFTYKTLIIH